MKNLNHCDVLIIGAGPVGLTTAAFLNHYGIDVKIIDKNSQATTTSNAVGMQARTLELFQLLGLDQAFMKAGKHVRFFAAYRHQKIIGTFDFNHVSSDHHYICNIPQSATESILIDHLAQHNLHVERRKTLTGFTTQNNGVTASITTPTNDETIHCNWLIACDGYHSTVREQLNVPYRGDDLPQKFLMIDAPVTWTEPLDSICLSTEKNLGLTLFPMLNSVRMILEVSHNKKYKGIETFDQQLFMDVAQSCLPGTMNIGTPLWQSHFWVHERLADHYNIDRVFLVGDAAHAHSPAGGQGMNTGMQDAINLSWKLAWTIKGHGSAQLLQSYQQERRPVAQRVLKRSSKMTKIGMGNSLLPRLIRNYIAPLLLRTDAVQKAFTNYIAETDINYRNSAIVSGTAQQHLYPGDRIAAMPLIDTTHKCVILDFSGDLKNTCEEFATIAKIHTIKSPQQLANTTLAKLKCTYCVIRPDLYIGYMGNDQHALKDYLKLLTQDNK